MDIGDSMLPNFAPVISKLSYKIIRRSDSKKINSLSIRANWIFVANESSSIEEEKVFQREGSATIRYFKVHPRKTFPSLFLTSSASFVLPFPNSFEKPTTNQPYHRLWWNSAKRQTFEFHDERRSPRYRLSWPSSTSILASPNLLFLPSGGREGDSRHNSAYQSFLQSLPSTVGRNEVEKDRDHLTLN